jgi:predicted nucleic acid-binding protein
VLAIDTGIFVSAADGDEPRHLDCATLLRNHTDLTVSASVIPEAAWLIERRLGPAAEARFLTLVTSRRFTIIDLVRSDYQPPKP